jgi:hypothetical protein
MIKHDLTCIFSKLVHYIYIPPRISLQRYGRSTVRPLCAQIGSHDLGTLDLCLGVDIFVGVLQVAYDYSQLAGDTHDPITPSYRELFIKTRLICGNNR